MALRTRANTVKHTDFVTQNCIITLRLQTNLRLFFVYLAQEETGSEREREREREREGERES
jgi:hypothetical protein